MREIAEASVGLATYGTKNRKQYLKADGRKSYVYTFSRWDRIVQANAYAGAYAQLPDVAQIPSLQQVLVNLP